MTVGLLPFRAHWHRRVLVLAAGLLASAVAARSPAPSPRPTIGPAPQPAPPACVTLWASARFTVLTARLLRLELAGESGSFDDRPSLAVISRLGGVEGPCPTAFSISTAGNALTLTTSAATVVYAPAGGNSTRPRTNSTCPLAQNADIADGVRTPSWPDGANVTSIAQCCALCDADPDCSTWIFATSPAAATPPADRHAGRQSLARRALARGAAANPPANCWLMMGVTRLNPSSNRVSGAILPFSPADLNVTFSVNGAATTWTPGMVDTMNLGGAFHALDCYDTPGNCTADYDSAMQPGLLSRAGWAVLDDTSSARLVAPAAGVPSPVPFWYANATAHSRPAADLYFFAHGLDYAAALADYALIGGPPALPPSSVFGVWWSHWQPFNQSFFETDILANYKKWHLPLNHVMLDVDWHTELSSLPSNKSVTCYDYGGYTVNDALWPAWSSFVASLKDGTNPSGLSGLRLMLNLHPQGGTDACQANWAAFASALNYTSSTLVPCTFGVQAIAAASFSAFMDADVLANVDGWWTDFDYDGDCFDAPTASTPSSFPGIAWSNEVFGQHQRSSRGRRPLVLSRSGGLGAHRNPVSFSGDANQHQDILRWELENTPLAANVLHSTWSHDIGGFMCQSLPQANCSGDPTQLSNGLLYLRWIQAGVTLPVLRTHASTWGLPVMERRVWAFPDVVSPHMMEALRLRSAIQPYTYSEARSAYDTAVAIVRPLYMAFPEFEEAYNSSLTGGPQHMFGSVLLASSIFDADATAQRSGGDSTLGSVRQSWLPPGDWTNFNGSRAFSGPAVVTEFYSLGDLSIFAPQGAVIPMKTNASTTAAFADPLVLTVFPSFAGSTSSNYNLYEDDGDSNDFEAGAFSTTLITTSFSVLAPVGNTLTVNPAQGPGFRGQGAARRIIVHFRGFRAASGNSSPSAVFVDKVAVPTGAPGCAGCFYIVPEAEHSVLCPAGTLVVDAGAASIVESVQVVANW